MATPLMKPVVFAPEAREEFNAAATYYEEQRPGLGDHFVEEIERQVGRIAQTLQAFPIHQRSAFRKCVLPRFPYTLFFLDLDDRIWIAAVAHQRRKPGFWMHRQPE